ncbi:hypothetical protein [Aeromicrobium sp. 179-A 4D2 NHS]|uniref:hypothetical protein n=1 Tax=Aeromicrobium sp. 179-A 4D2 NHS TaxID=3142375 RepID=UPI0039A3F19D
MTKKDVVERLADAITEAALQVSDGTRPIDPDDAKQIAQMLVYGTDAAMPVWLTPAGLDVLTTFTVNIEA